MISGVRTTASSTSCMSVSSSLGIACGAGRGRHDSGGRDSVGSFAPEQDGPCRRAPSCFRLAFWISFFRFPCSVP